MLGLVQKGGFDKTPTLQGFFGGNFNPCLISTKNVAKVWE